MALNPSRKEWREMMDILHDHFMEGVFNQPQDPEFLKLMGSIKHKDGDFDEPGILFRGSYECPRCGK